MDQRESLDVAPAHYHGVNCRSANRRTYLRQVDGMNCPCFSMTILALALAAMPSRGRCPLVSWPLPSEKDEVTSVAGCHQCAAFPDAAGNCTDSVHLAIHV